MLEQVIRDITNFGGWISGSYVRDFMVRGEKNLELINDIDVLISFDKFEKLQEMFIDKWDASYEIINESDEEKIAHYEFEIEDFIFDVFAYDNYSHYSYCCPPDVDVNTLCWNDTEYISWFIHDKNGYTVDDIIKRCHNMKAIAMTEEWDLIRDGENDYTDRIKKLIDKGWTILYDEIKC